MGGVVVVFVLVGGWFAMVVVPIAVDVRSGRGTGLAILSSLLLACTLLVFVTLGLAALQQQLEPPTSLHSYGVGIWLLFYFVPAAYATLATLIGAAIVAGIAGHWRWIVGFFVAVLVPVLVAVPPHPFLDMNTEYIVQQVGFLGMLVVPEATVLAYSITRLVHPVVPAPARQHAPRS
jgi:hypothetical protein